MRRGLIVLVSAIAVVAAACGGDDSSQSDTTTTSSSSSTSTSTSTSTTGAPAPTTTTQPGPTTCQTTALAATIGNLDAGAGQRHATLVFTNNGPVPCTMFGYIGMQLLGPGNQKLPTNVVRDPSIPKSLVTLNPGGGQAFTTLQWTVIASGNEPQDETGCQPNPSQVALTPPNESDSLFQPWPNGPVCNGGQFRTDPMQPGGGPPAP